MDIFEDIVTNSSVIYVQLLQILGACLQVWNPSVGEVSHLCGVTRLSMESLILIWSRFYDMRVTRRGRLPGLPDLVTLSAWIKFC